MGQWVLGAALSALVALAHAQPGYAPHESHGGGGFQHAPAMRPTSGGARGGWGQHTAGPAAAPARREAGEAAYGGGRGVYGVSPLHVADQGGWHGGGGGGAGREPGENAGGGNGYGGGYHGGPITPVSAQAHEVPHPPADSPVRTGSIREDVARYNEERGAFRPFPRNTGDVPHPPMPSPYRN
jgi:hypothetical protein